MFPRRVFPSLPSGVNRAPSWRLTSKSPHPRNSVSSWRLENLEGRVLLSRGAAILDLLTTPTVEGNRPPDAPNDQTVVVRVDPALTIEPGDGHSSAGGGASGTSLSTSDPSQPGPPQAVSSEVSLSTPGGPGGGGG